MEIKINLKNCYGINSFNHTFDFSTESTYAIYAPNGSMKTSFSKTLDDYSKNVDSSDMVYPERTTTRIIKADDIDMNKDDIFVIKSYDEEYSSSNISTLLVNKKLRDEYQVLHSEINNKKESFIKEINKNSGLKPKDNIEKIISETFTPSPNDFFKAILRIQTEVRSFNSEDLNEIKYSDVFNSNTLAILEDNTFIKAIKNYIETYSQLIDNSSFFKKDTFNHNNAEEIAKKLHENGFFNANHSVNITTDGNGNETKINNLDDLQKAIKNEKEKILSNEELKADFNKIDTILTKNAARRNFRTFIKNHSFIIPYLDNIKDLKEKIIISYCKKSLGLYNELLTKYADNEDSIKRIIDKASIEKSKWENVVIDFNKRFDVPFTVKITNQNDAILNKETPNIQFDFKDRRDASTIPMKRKDLFHILSGGEKRALYLLNIIFEIEARKQSSKTTLFIVDDIADSFDYKNKYAIIEYLKDISEQTIFQQIILTHNFDFYRTVSSRIEMDRKNKFHVLKNDDKVSLKQETYQKNPFNTWAENCNKKNSSFIAMIPFVRNLAEYCRKPKPELKMTSLLHIKKDTKSLTKSDVYTIFKEIVDLKQDVQKPDDKVYDIIFEETNNIIRDNNEDLELENKIILSIAIRLKAEEFMISKINNASFVNSIDQNQTRMLMKEYKELFPAEIDNIDTIKSMNLMTPENIHLNSFMYEPLLDMSNEHLKSIYESVNNLS